LIIENQATDAEAAHKIEILCPSCSADVTQEELDKAQCSDCGADLATPQQNVEIHATSVPAFIIAFTG
jgi:Zn finger protein HypA/HybF involved in hydrogenase expression